MITQYHRPPSLDEALALVSLPGTVPLAGGTSLTAVVSSASVEVVDLQSLGLDGIRSNKDTVSLGATTPLQELVNSPLIPAVLRDLAHREAPNTIRNAATVGGTIAAADAESELVAGLLAFEATVSIARMDASQDLPLASILADAAVLEGAIITAVSVATNGSASAHRTARTPADRPIVAIVARRTQSGDTVVAATGLASHPMLVAIDQLEDLQPPADFRGSGEYRIHLASVLIERALHDIDADGAP